MKCAHPRLFAALAAAQAPNIAAAAALWAADEGDSQRSGRGSSRATRSAAADAAGAAFAPRHVATFAWSFAAAGLNDAQLIKAVALFVARRGGELAPLGLTTVCWALATWGCADEDALAAAEEAAMAALPRMQPQVSWGRSCVLWNLRVATRCTIGGCISPIVSILWLVVLSLLNSIMPGSELVL